MLYILQSDDVMDGIPQKIQRRRFFLVPIDKQ